MASLKVSDELARLAFMANVNTEAVVSNIDDPDIIEHLWKVPYDVQLTLKAQEN